jgi:phenylpyruvate tautomerase PptA (4-oxalocrotonate tautomerase family)
MEDAMAHTAPTREDAPAPPHAEGRTRYADDVYTWVQEQVALLRAGQVDALDLDNIAEELSDVGSEQYDKLESAIEVLLAHMLKWDHQPERRSRSWSLTIAEQRVRIDKQLRRNPGLKSRIVEAITDGYRLGRLRAAREMKRSPNTFPEECPYTWDDILNRPFEFEADR